MAIAPQPWKKIEGIHAGYMRMRAKGAAEPDASELMTVVEPTRNINLYQLIEIVPLVYTTKTQIIKLSEHHWWIQVNLTKEFKLR